MKSKLLLGLALVLSVALLGCSTVHPSQESVIYHNAKYHFTFSLPSSWRGYSVSIEQVADENYSPAEDKQIVVAHTPMITLRHPHWCASAPNQDIPILIFTRAQWDSLNHGRLWPSAFAGGVMDELWHNQKFVFAMSSRYNAADGVKGRDEVENIVRQNCAVHSMARLYPE